MSWFSRESRERRGHAKRYRAAIVEEVVQLLFETAEEWPNVPMPLWPHVPVEDFARGVASLADGDSTILRDVRNHPRVEQLRQILLKDPPLIGRSRLSDRDRGMAMFILGFQSDPRVVKEFARYRADRQARE